MKMEAVYSEGKLTGIIFEEKADKQITPDTDNWNQLVSCLEENLLSDKLEDTRELKKIIGEGAAGWQEKDYEKLREDILKQKEIKYKKYQEAKRSITLTNKQWNVLEFFLLSSTQYRKSELETLKNIAIPAAERAAEKYQRRMEILEEIIQVIGKR